ncbi:HNH endonuclease [Lawsonella clevelandensis]|uniref:HNH endonuclease n=1 Tax=Lawsonella clevelandensis TaxID=1528099 RepID=UPI0032D8B696
MQTIRKQYKHQCQQNNTPCWLCGQPINYNLPTTHQQSFTIDHMLPYSTHPHLLEDQTNFRPAHRHCNIQRSNKTPTSLGTLSRNW